jgi:hypothetical protein
VGQTGYHVDHVAVDPDQFRIDLDEADLRYGRPELIGDPTDHLIVEGRAADLGTLCDIIVSVVTGDVDRPASRIPGSPVCHGFDKGRLEGSNRWGSEPSSQPHP